MSSTSVGNGYSPYSNYCNNQSYDNYFNGKVGAYPSGVQNYDHTYPNYYYMLPVEAGDHYPYGTPHQYLAHSSLTSPLVYGVHGHNLDADKNGFGKAYTNAAFSSGSLPSVAGVAGAFEINNQKTLNNGYNYQQNQFCMIVLIYLELTKKKNFN